MVALRFTVLAGWICDVLCPVSEARIGGGSISSKRVDLGLAGIIEVDLM